MKCCVPCNDKETISAIQKVTYKKPVILKNVELQNSENSGNRFMSKLQKKGVIYVKRVANLKPT